ncbi:glucose/arabinose dehydrogenase [Deinobacterium chartae]|uniref:Glucose/arabinose dehydrogenase n=1 Tax=Deinobacterium chartae TaxID=521158 RepID=A0A841I201_9DEIO|nr:ScyD/ScyE family protein [Deinobacterium chartae]MBB6098082.1 glucose/arabinose dehydrogenase [Deinobacterium chartae]
MGVPLGPIRSAHTLTALLTAGLLAACNPSGSPTPPPDPEPTVVATGLNGPQGVLVDADGTLWVTDDGLGGDTVFEGPDEQGNPAEGNYGNSARLIRVDTNGNQSVVAQIPSVDPPLLAVGPSGGGKLAMLGGEVYFTNGVWNAAYSIARPSRVAAVLTLEGNLATEISDIFAFEVAANPDGVPPELGGIDSHPYGLAAGADGQLYVADAGGNSLLRVDPVSGDVNLVANLQGLTGTGPQSVPTGVTFDENGDLYVALLSGFPFPEGAAKVVQVDPDNGSTDDFATGMTLLTDLELGPDGNLYAVSFGRFDLTAPGGYVGNAGAVIRLLADGTKETVLSGLNFPTAIAFDAEGNAYVAENGIGEPGSGEVVRYPNLTDAEAE